MKTKLSVIVGPTASGKTALSIELARRMDAEIVSADSIQLYRGCDIGSAKPTLNERQGIVHHLMDVYEPFEENTGVARYKALAEDCIDEIAARGKFPLLVGGTGLYVNALVYPLSFTGAGSSPALREELAKMEQETPGSLHQMLKELDKSAAKRLHPNDIKRVIRAIEVVKLTGKTMDEHGGDFENKRNEEIPYDVRMVGLTMPREALYERIERRVDSMMQQGFLSEVRALKEAGVPRHAPSMQGLGYKQLYGHLEGESTLDEAISAVKLETRRFAKRQLTWFKRDARIKWLDISAYESFDKLVLDAQSALTAKREGEGE